MHVPVLGLHEECTQGFVPGSVALADGVGQVGGVVAAQRHAHEVVEAVAFEGSLEGHLGDDHVFYKGYLVVDGVLTGGERVGGQGHVIVGVAL